MSESYQTEKKCFVLLDDEQKLTHNFSVLMSNNSNLPNFTLPSEGFIWQNFKRFCLAETLKRHQ